MICIDIYTFQKEQVVPNNRRSVYLSKNKEVILFTNYNRIIKIIKYTHLKIKQKWRRLM